MSHALVTDYCYQVMYFNNRSSYLTHELLFYGSMSYDLSYPAIFLALYDQRLNAPPSPDLVN